MHAMYGDKKMLRGLMNTKPALIYQGAFVWCCYQLIRGANAPEEKWRGYIGDAIWMFSFLSFAFISFITLLSSNFIPEGRLVFGDQALAIAGVSTYLLLVGANYYHTKHVIGYEFIYSKLGDQDYLNKGRKYFFGITFFLFATFASSIIFIILA
ncbi:hypothetical protein [Isoalcanivorax indicus]|uniref:hypothetical protein n=1 Tax=Isoalcanivorax indicus TaxID=2202653 RepID=UPI0013C44F06|nr:hypothetical protein [Isoalcanivorax indicus]